MLIVRELMYCKPGKVRPLVEKFVAMAKVSQEAGQPGMRIMTDLCAERYWTVACEFEVASLQAFDDMMAGKGMTPELGKRMEGIMEGYHDLVEYGRREIYKVEGS